MKAPILICGIVVVGSAIWIGLQQKTATELRDTNGRLQQELAEARAASESADATAKANAAETGRIQQEHAELLKLRGEVVTLRKEKEDWEKRRAEDRKTALVAAVRAAAQTKDLQTLEQDRLRGVAQAILDVLNSPREAQAATTGNIRRKALTGEPLTDAERGILNELAKKTAEIEKSPQEFASFQSAYIASVLGWNNDPRMAQVQGLLNRAASAANERGFDYHAPGENAGNWNEQQQMLNQRATGAVQGMLSPEERALFDKAFIGVLGVDFGGGAQAK